MQDANPTGQASQMKWILFAIFTVAFVLIVIGTIMALFFGFGTLLPSERNILFGAFIVEIGAGVVALFYSAFGLKPKNEGDQANVRFSLGGRNDWRPLVGKSVTLSASDKKNSSLRKLETRILTDTGPYIPLDLPSETHSVYFEIVVNDKQTYAGSIIVGTYLVKLDLIQNQDGA